jgi:hypothetical protein
MTTLKLEQELYLSVQEDEDGLTIELNPEKGRSSPITAHLLIAICDLLNKPVAATLFNLLVAEIPAYELVLKENKYAQE